MLGGCAGGGPLDGGDAAGTPFAEQPGRPGSDSPVSPGAPGLRATPSPEGTCPPAGVRIRLGTGDAAMGLRVTSLVLVNCGTEPYEVDGYPSLRPLGEQREPLDVEVLHGAKKITISLPHLDAPPRPVRLKPGEAASAGIVWRNTYDDITNPPVTVPFVEVAPATGRPAQILPVDVPFDLGSTGRLGVSPWEPFAASAPGPDPAPSESPSVSSSPSPDLPLL
ncbi:hypothetical protein ACTI_49030 [Actinoplanes sp. OR16]|nr:hypothetical protein ACTI_49030 [Actinoplanes sp. OR16]